MSVQRVAVLLNKSAGRGVAESDERAAIEEAFATIDVEADIHEIDPRDMSGTIGRLWAASPRPDAVVVAGGDGTVSCAAGAVVGTDVVLAVLPTGTFNHFAKDLGIPVGIDDAVHALVDARPTRVDVAEVNGRVFVNNSVLGIYPEMIAVRDRLRSGRGWGKVRAVPVASISVLRTFPVHRVDITAPGGVVKRRLRTPLVFVGNGLYDNGPGGMPCRDSLSGARLGVGFALASGRARLILSALRSLLRGQDAESDVDVIELTEVTITSRTKRLRVALDGEITKMSPPLRYRSIPGALQVLVPVPPEPRPDDDDPDAEPFTDRLPDPEPEQN